MHGSGVQTESYVGGTMFFNNNDDLGASLFKTWTDEQRRDEIEKLVVGYRSGVPVGILCNMAEVIAGSREIARGILMELLTPEERQLAVEKEMGGMQVLLKEYFQ